jgi:hypothetical protein
MSDSITLDTPEQINMWVLLSRRHQVQLHLKGLKVKNLVKWGKLNFPDANIRTAKDMIVPIEYAISQAGGNVDYRLVNVHVLSRTKNPTVFQDMGIYENMAAVEALPGLVNLYSKGALEIVLTLDAPRDANGELFIPA